MYKLILTAIFFAGIACILNISACTNDNPVTADKAKQKSTVEIKKLIGQGKKAETANNDSSLIVSKKLYQLYRQSADNSALVYAELFEAENYWQAADHKKAMLLAVRCLADAEKYNIRWALADVYGLIANLHKETTNFPMAFKAANEGLAVAVHDKDSTQIIAFLGLKAMLTRSLNLTDLKPGPDKSIDLNLAALKIAESSPKYERLRIRFYDNICQYYKDQRDFEKAYYYGNKGVALATKLNQQRSLTYAYSWLGQANYFQGRHAQGILLLNRALQIATTIKAPYRIMEIHEHMYDCYISSGDYKNALDHLTRGRTMRDSLKMLDNVKQISALQLEYETAKKDKLISDLDAKTRLESLERNAIIVVLALLIAISVLIYVKEKKGKDLILFEKQLVDKELKNAELELLYFTENLKQKNEIIEEFKAEIEHLQLKNITAADKDNLDNIIKAHIMTDENWDSFKKLFAKVHAGFFDRLKQQHPNLTTTDIRILSLIKLQLSNHEMANTLGITIEGIKKSKQRLRKKMELNKDESLESITTSL